MLRWSAGAMLLVGLTGCAHQPPRHRCEYSKLRLGFPPAFYSCECDGVIEPATQAERAQARAGPSKLGGHDLRSVCVGTVTATTEDPHGLCWPRQAHEERPHCQANPLEDLSTDATHPAKETPRPRQ